MWTPGSDEHFDVYFEQCMDLLAPLFQPARDDVHGLFEFVCCLVHPAGFAGLDENPLIETVAVIEDLIAFSRQNLQVQDFDHPERTRARLALVSYCHLTEGDFFYSLLANLLQIRCGERWAFAPFADLQQVRHKGTNKEKRLPAPLKQKVDRLQEYAVKAEMPEVIAAFKAIYISEIRNAVFHADYTVSDMEFHMMRDYWLSPKGFLTRDIPFAELFALIDRSFAFYYALLNRHELARTKFNDFKNKALPFDLRLKGLIEFLFEDDLICGFRVYWPNGEQAESTRTSTGSRAVNLYPNLQGGLNIEVGLYATTPGTFSPLVESGQQPAYSPATGRTTAPYWPSNLEPVPLE